MTMVSSARRLTSFAPHTRQDASITVATIPDALLTHEFEIFTTYKTFYCTITAAARDLNTSRLHAATTTQPIRHALPGTAPETNMASIFTFDPDPPRVSSPWATPHSGDHSETRKPPIGATPLPSKPSNRGSEEDGSAKTQTNGLDYTGIKRLEAEPQEGPTEYKLHLLLRRRRSFTRASTGQQGHHVSGSLRRTDIPVPVPAGRSVSDSGLLPETPPLLASTQSKQHRLEQLTTQLLWRLQQSCSHHISSSTGSIMPHFPDVSQLSTPEMPQRLLPGLEESQGALYEIGVADDGTIVGLAEDEMEESLNNLRAMAASLGCGVEVQRRVPVGDCEWLDYAGTPQQKTQSSQLWVAEALVRPEQHLVDYTRKFRENAQPAGVTPTPGRLEADGIINESHTVTEQLRVSVTGATMSGKSSLLGTLSTATLDNGRGKSRLGLLKHRHEIASGMTSSVTQELIGYSDDIQGANTTATHAISYGSGDVSSWADIHAAVESAEQGRLVFLSDSAGHPRFRRTTVRGIVGWQPHWTLLCVPADDTDDSSGKIGASPTSEELLGPAAADFDLSHAHLQLCLALELPLVIVITKYDLATKAGLRQTLSKLLSVLKEAGRRPCIISDTSPSVLEADLHDVSATDFHEAGTIVKLLQDSLLAAVPVILTSAVKGSGIQKLHAFLRQLPVPSQPSPPPPTSPSPLFYIEDVYSVRASTSTNRSAIIGGYLRYGSLAIGSELVLGPYPIDTTSDDSDSSNGRQPPRKSLLPTSRSFPGALASKASRNAGLRHQQAEWRRVCITSLRNLRLPVRVLHAGQVGTMGITPVDSPAMVHTPSIQRIRKGMVLAARESTARKVIAVRFEGKQACGVRGCAVGSAVVVYINSVRASSKVLSVSTAGGIASASATAPIDNNNEDTEDGFGFNFDDESVAASAQPSPEATLVKFQFLAAREFVEMGARVLVMPGGGPGLSGGNERGAKGLAGLEGFVGKLVDE
ncbi:similar to GTP-binding protein 2 [Plenodomus lingam JN3]|uniref:Similar to GTP-binding protein 2 n=1 Tax=Leptosphaeria maculans (strain JN3 / isolate v23.1.3 / race Av1-4-5-6-7-8) TaxID=985895 RepID=E5A3A2_LEPMJ|nr:similar to GTP-binding protein 2 [Plenodomus lingam JN3]CBX98115.1 similar to GTP-binding protein 2 [Plenodomus lingam JN3]